MVDNRKTKEIDRVHIGDLVLSIRVRVNPDTGSCSIYCPSMSKSIQCKNAASYRILNKDIISKHDKNYYYKYRDKILMEKKTHYIRNSDRILEEKHNYYINNPRIKFLNNSYCMEYLNQTPCGYVWHHTCYDHADPEANCVLLSYESHTMGHRLLQKLGIKIPHINMEI